MELTYSLVQLLVALSVVHASVVHLKETEASGVTEAISEEQRKIHQECRNPDYKKYVMCLMRPKRHHHIHADTPENDPVHCLEECLKKCSDLHDCDKKCGHCSKRTKHRHQIVTEYEVNCESGNCYGTDDLRTTNITTNIDINNIINTYPNGTGPGRDGGPGTGRPGTGIGIGTGTETGIETGGENGFGPGNGRPGNGRPGNGRPGNGRPGNGGPGPGPGIDAGTGISVGINETVSSVAVPSIPLVPQISMVPQITYGINLAGGCVFSTWLCIQQGATRRVQTSNVQPDCSVCGNPLLQHRCNVTFCYAASSVSTACKSPACVGGST